MTGWIEDAEALKSETVYFDFDSSVLKAAEKPKVAAVADYLKANSAKAVRVEGNCDERGTEEYNRSLGERRALAVREELIRLGIDPTGLIRSATAKISPQPRATMKPPGSKTAGTTSSFCRRPSSPATGPEPPMARASLSRPPERGHLVRFECRVTARV